MRVALALRQGAYDTHFHGETIHFSMPSQSVSHLMRWRVGEWTVCMFLFDPAMSQVGIASDIV